MNQSVNTSEDKDASEIKALELAAYPAAAITGGVVLKSSVEDKLYDNLKRLNQLPEISSHREAFKTTSVTMGEKVAIELPKFHAGFSKIYDDKLHKLGFTSFAKRFGGLHKGQKLDALMHGITAAGITVGVFLTVANSKLLEKFSGKKDETQTR